VNLVTQHPQDKIHIPLWPGWFNDAAADGDSLYVTTVDSLLIFDLADPAAPALVSQWRPAK